jgi:hypothetical protein
MERKYPSKFKNMHTQLPANGKDFLDIDFWLLVEDPDLTGILDVG